MASPLVMSGLAWEGVMPKEAFYGPQVDVLGQADGLGGTINRLDVAWGIESHVQIGVLRHAGLDDPNGPIDDGFWVDLDRKRINDLIRTLRKARDQAYGIDE